MTYARPRWKAGDVLILDVEGKATFARPGATLGNIGIVPRLDHNGKPDAWVLYHQPSGLGIATTRTRAVGRQLAGRIAAEFGPAFLDRLADREYTPGDDDLFRRLKETCYPHDIHRSRRAGA